MTRITLFILSSCLIVSGWFVGWVEDPSRLQAQPPAKKLPDRPVDVEKSKGTNGERNRPSADRKLPIPPGEMMKRFGGGPNSVRSARPVAILGARIASQSSKGTFEADIVLSEGKIAAIGKNLDIPPNAVRLPGKDLTLTPGLIDVRGSLGLDGDEQRTGVSDASLDPRDGFDVTTEDWRELHSQGVTAVCIHPPGSLGGAVSVLRVGEANMVEALTLSAASAVHGELNAQPSAGNAVSRYSSYEQLKSTLEAAKKYGEDWDKYREELRKAEEKKASDSKKKAEPEKAKAEEKPKEPEKKKSAQEQAEEMAQKMPNYDRLPDQFKKRIVDQIKQRIESGQPITFGRGPPGSGPRSSTDGPAKPKLDPAKEQLLRVIKGEIPLRLEVHRAEDVRLAYKLADDLKIRLVLEGLSEAKSVADHIRKNRTPLVLGPFLDFDEESIPVAVGAPQTPGRGRGRRGAAPTPIPIATAQTAPRSWKRDARWPNFLIEKDTRFAIATFAKSGRESQFLRAHAAAAVAQGVDSDAALSAITSHAALIAGVGNRLGSLEVGKIADVVAFAGDPLNPAVPVAFVISAGAIVYRNDAVQRVESTLAQASVPKKLPSVFSLTSKNILDESGSFKPGKLTVTKGQFSTTSPNGTTIDVGDCYITPGLVAGPDDYGLSTGGGDEAELSGGSVRASDAFDADHVPFRKLSRGGFTNVVLSPAPTFVTAGVCASVRLGNNPELVDIGPLFALTNQARNTERFPASLAGQIQVVESVFAKPNQRWAFQDGGPSARFYVDPTPARDTVVLIDVHEEAEVWAALSLAQQYGRRLALIQPTDFRKYLGAIKASKTALVVPASKRDDYQFSARQIVEASKMGIPIIFGGSSPMEIRLTASMAVNGGMPANLVMKSLTAMGAESLGMPAGTATFRQGRSADAVIWSGPPWDLRSRVLGVISEGQLVIGGGDQS